VRIVYKRYIDWPITIQKRLRSLTHKDDMLKDLVDSTPQRVHTFVAFEGESIVGWSIASYCGHRNIYFIMLYVHRYHRSKGIGTKLYRRAFQWTKRQKKQIVVCRHDYKSRVFFDKMLRYGLTHQY
jgi:L-amino acid N-acyltransferase YncA